MSMNYYPDFSLPATGSDNKHHGVSFYKSRAHGGQLGTNGSSVRYG
jgi:hypothetical protein